MKSALIAAVLGLSSVAFVGCASRHEEGVKSTLRSQYTSTTAGVEETTSAAEAVLNDKGLKDVRSSATRVDGSASGKMADGTDVRVKVAKDKEAGGSAVTVTVGTLGSPTLGAEIAKDIKTRAEGATRTGDADTLERRATTRRSTMD